MKSRVYGILELAPPPGGAGDKDRCHLRVKKIEMGNEIRGRLEGKRKKEER
jgi:hypothetical protein